MPLYKYKNLRKTRDMRVLVASLGFSYHHVMAAANRCRPGKIALATVNPENERTKKLHAPNTHGGTHGETAESQA